MTFERKVFSRIHTYYSKKSLRETREYRLLVSTDAEAARAGYRQTDKHDNYSNPRACAPRVNYAAEDAFHTAAIKLVQCRAGVIQLMIAAGNVNCPGFY